MRSWFWRFGILAGIVVFGLVSWPARLPVQWLGHRLTKSTGWEMECERVRWAPWRLLEIQQMRLRGPRGEQIRVAQVQMKPQILSMAKGYLQVSGRLKMLQAATTPSTPLVAEDGSFILRWYPKHLDIENIQLQGSEFQFEAKRISLNYSGE